MSILQVGIGEYQVSAAEEDLIKTYALGSCVGVIVYDNAERVGGLLHVAYPDSATNPQKAKSLPGYFVDSGMPRFLHSFKELSSMERQNIVIRLAGGANMLDEQGRFNIGKRNLLAIKRFLWRLGMGVIQEDSGGTVSRSVSFSIATGRTYIYNGSHAWEL